MVVYLQKVKLHFFPTKGCWSSFTLLYSRKTRRQIDTVGGIWEMRRVSNNQNSSFWLLLVNFTRPSVKVFAPFLKVPRKICTAFFITIYYYSTKWKIGNTTETTLFWSPPRLALALRWDFVTSSCISAISNRHVRYVLYSSWIPAKSSPLSLVLMLQEKAWHHHA